MGRPTNGDTERRDLNAAGLTASEARRIKGYALVFNRLSEDLGGFREQIAPEAVLRTLREGLDVRALFNHNPEIVLGRTKAGTLRLDKDPHGLAVTIDPPDPVNPPNLLESIRRGDISGMSFSFRTLEDSWDFKTDPPTRTLLDMIVREVSPVTFPAYSDTSIAVRSMDDAARLVGWKPSMGFRERLLRVMAR